MAQRAFYHSIVSELEQGRGVELKNLIRPSRTALPNGINLADMETFLVPKCGREYTDVLVGCVGVSLSLAASPARLADAYESSIQTFSLFLDIFEKETSSNWSLPLMQQLAVDARVTALRLDDDEGRGAGDGVSRNNVDKDVGGGSSARHSKVSELLTRCFSICYTDRAPLDCSKKWGYLGVINQMFKLYFSINQLVTCKNLVKNVDHCRSPELEEFNISDRVTYSYYRGRLAMSDDDCTTAQLHLHFAFSNTARKYHRHRRLILSYLVPVNMQLGRLPTQDLLQHYKLTQYSDLATALRSGNISLFASCLDDHHSFFIERGVYLMLGKLKSLVFCRLFKRVVSSVRQWGFLGDRPYNIPLQYFVDALRVFGEDMDLDEVECVVANLIYSKYVKGIIGHNQRTLAISKELPFPSIRKIASA